MSQLSLTQLDTLKARILAQPSLASLPNNGDSHQIISNWFNAPADGTEVGFPSAILLVWKEDVSIAALNGVIIWSASPAGALDSEKTNSWLKWQSMTWANFLDMSDSQVRQGVDDVWGAGSASANAIKGTACGKRTGTRFEVLYGAEEGTAIDSLFYGKKLVDSDVVDALNRP